MDPDFFNDPYAAAAAAVDEEASSYPLTQDELTSKLKRTACVLCRKRKLKCDAARPKCATCDRLGHLCEYNEARKKSGPKRGYVKALEARLSQVETQLKSSPSDLTAPLFQAELPRRPARQDSSGPSESSTFDDHFRSRPDVQTYNPPSGASMSKDTLLNSVPPPKQQTWDMISLGLEEPLPTQDIQDELHDIYFRKIHPALPMIHKARFYTALNNAPNARPPACLRYAMWCLAAGASDAYADMQPHFYRRARKYKELDEMRSFGEAVMSLWACQTSVLLGVYEFKNMHFPRAWLSAGRATRIAQMLGIHRLDGGGLEIKQCLPPPADWLEKEERKRTFWMVFWCDRCASMGTGWPMTIEEADIVTQLPSSDAAYHNGVEEPTPTLEEALAGHVRNLSPFAGAIILSALFGRNLLHLHRPGVDEREHDLNGNFWRRHRSIDQTLLNISLNLPDHLRIPAGLPDPNCIFMHMGLHTSIICLHQAAIFKVDKNDLPTNIGQESKIRCVTAAAEIANIMRSISHCDLGSLNPFSAFCLYVASRVFVQYLKSRQDDQQVLGSLHFLLSAMHALKRKTPLAESFLAQLDVDLAGAGITTAFGSSIESLRRKGWPPSKHMHDREGGCGSNGIAASDINMTPAHHLGPNVDMASSGMTSAAPATRLAAPIGSTISWVDSPDYATAQDGSSSSGRISAASKLRTSGDRGWLDALGPAANARLQTFSSSDSDTRHGSADEMDLSPGHTKPYSTPSMQTQNSASTRHTSFTPPPTTEAVGRQDNPQTAYFDNAGSGHQGYDDNQPAGFITFKDYGDGAYTTTGPPASMTQAEFDSLTKNFMPPTPNGDLDGWPSSLGIGLTPGGPGAEWNSILEGMSPWDGTAQEGGNETWRTT